MPDQLENEPVSQDTTIQTLLRALLALPIAAALCACNGNPIQISGETGPVEAERAMVMPPPGSFPITGVAQRRFGNALQQDIYIATNSALPGQNVVKVSLFGTSGLMRYGENRLAFQPLTESRVGAELRRTFPGLAMVRSPYLTHNSYGSFGYAVGRPASGETCLYAWQLIRAKDGEAASGSGAIDLRVRLCDRGASEASLLQFMYGLTITAAVDAKGWNPYGTPSVNATMPAGGAYTQPVANLLPAMESPASSPVSAQPSAPVRRSTSRVVTRPQAVAAPEPSAQTSNVAIPSPALISPDMTGSVAAGSSIASPAPTLPAQAAAGVIVPSPACLGGGPAGQGQCP